MNTIRIFAWLKRNTEVGYMDRTSAYGTYLGHRYRFFPDSSLLQIGDKDFDRWANSVGAEATIDGNGNIMKQIHFAIDLARGNRQPLVDRIVAKIESIRATL